MSIIKLRQIIRPTWRTATNVKFCSCFAAHNFYNIILELLKTEGAHLILSNLGPPLSAYRSGFGPLLALTALETVSADHSVVGLH